MPLQDVHETDLDFLNISPPRENRQLYVPSPSPSVSSKSPALCSSKLPSNIFNSLDVVWAFLLNHPVYNFTQVLVQL